MPNTQIDENSNTKPTTIDRYVLEPHSASERDTENKIERERERDKNEYNVKQKRAQAYYMRLIKIKSNQFHYRYIGRGGGGGVSWHRLMFFNFGKFKLPYIFSAITHSTRACNEL